MAFKTKLSRKKFRVIGHEKNFGRYSQGENFIYADSKEDVKKIFSIISPNFVIDKISEVEK